MMRRGLHVAVAVTTLTLFTGFAFADSLATLSDLDLIDKTREAVVDQNAAAALALLTEMQRRGTGIFAGVEKTVCEETISLPDRITDWKFRAVARQAYFRVAMSKRLAEGSCACLFDEFSFDAFVEETLGKPVADLTDADRMVLESIRDQDRRETEARFRDLEKSCRAQ
ncbi:MAG: hypothetical protein ACT4OK_00560 [Gemmobacter sp.]